jgi:DNA-binding transcriptional ArsR family regulator
MFNRVVEQLDAVFHAMADPTRRAMVRTLAAGEQTVGELAATVHGRRHVCRLEAQPLAAASRHLRFYEQFWTERLDALDAFVTGGEESS